jgi:hypothetical protein
MSHESGPRRGATRNSPSWPQGLEAALQEGDALARHNQCLVIAFSYGCGMIGTDMMYSLLDNLRARFSEDDVQAMVCGHKCVQAWCVDTSVCRPWCMMKRVYARSLQQGIPSLHACRLAVCGYR